VFGGSFSSRLLDAAVTAHRAAAAEPVLLAPDDRGAFGGGPYDDDDLEDDRAWAAAELWLATGDAAYAEAARRAFDFDLAGFDWNRVAAAAALDLALHGEGHERLIAAADRLRSLQDDQPWGQPYAPADGWDWGSNGLVLNHLVLLAAAHELTGRADLLGAAARGLDYLLGCNALGQSYVTGYGTDCTRHQRTRHFAHDLDPAFPPPPPGALAGGPHSKEYEGFPSDPRLAGLPPQRRYVDESTSETTNDVCIRWNAPLVWMAVFLTP
jgi:endoglucanase